MTDQDYTPLPWERQPDETDQAWAAFQQYRDLGPKHRSMPRLASEMVEMGDFKTSKPETRQRQLETWSSRHRWRDRVQAWDAQVDRRVRDESMDEILEMRRRQGQLARSAQIALSQPALEILRRLKEDELDLKALSDGDVIRLAVLATRAIPAAAQMERVARGDGLEQPETPVVPNQDFEMDADRMFEVWAALEEVGVDPRAYLDDYLNQEEKDAGDAGT